MKVVSISMSQEDIDRADELANKLTHAFGVKFSRAAVIRIALHELESNPELSIVAAYNYRKDQANDHE